MRSTDGVDHAEGKAVHLANRLGAAGRHGRCPPAFHYFPALKKGLFVGELLEQRLGGEVGEPCEVDLTELNPETPTDALLTVGA